MGKTLKMERLNLKEKKQAILEFIKRNGPSLPSKIAEHVKMPLLLTSALISELKSEGKLKVSNIKIGGSPLYYVEGQHSQLEQFTKYLPQKEKEAFELLKKEKVLDEEKIEPAYRIALSNLKDFSVPMKVKVNEEEKLFYRFYSFDKKEAIEKIQELLRKKEEKEERKIKKETREKREEKRQERKREKDAFRKKVLSWLEQKKLVVEKELDKESIFCSFDSEVGKLYFTVLFKKKKSIGEKDILLALQKAQETKHPLILLSDGKLTKKAEIALKKCGSFVLFKHI